MVWGAFWIGVIVACALGVMVGVLLIDDRSKSEPPQALPEPIPVRVEPLYGFTCPNCERCVTVLKPGYGMPDKCKRCGQKVYDQNDMCGVYRRQAEIETPNGKAYRRR